MLNLKRNSQSPGLLVSVRNVTEALTALEAGADVIDVKEPTRGSLGAADSATLAAIAQAVGGRAPVTAALGELTDLATPTALRRLRRFPRASSCSRLAWPAAAASPIGRHAGEMSSRRSATAIEPPRRSLLPSFMPMGNRPARLHQTTSCAPQSNSTALPYSSIRGTNLRATYSTISRKANCAPSSTAHDHKTCMSSWPAPSKAIVSTRPYNCRQTSSPSARPHATLAAMDKYPEGEWTI